MNISTGPFNITDLDKDCFRIKIDGAFTGAYVESLRDEVNKCISNEYDLIYIDVKEVSEMDLSGANEVINAHYSLEKAGKKLVLLYVKDSLVEDWVAQTGLDKYVATAIVPAS